MGSSQVKILKELREAGRDVFVTMEDERALDKLYKKGYVRWQAGEKQGQKAWAITDTGRDALEKRLA